MPTQEIRNLVRCECRRLGRGVVCDECQRRECFEWNWDKSETGSTVVFHNSDRNVIFNPGFSVGTVAVRGTQPFKQGYHHYWEIEMITAVYGTDMMIGVGTDKTDLSKYSHTFVSFLGADDQSWGLSYTGQKKHAGQSHPYVKQFGQYSVIGVHLDLWAGTLEFYLDRKPLGVAFNGLQGKVLYPIISSTAARSGMNLIFCRSYAPSLQLQAMLSLSHSQLSYEDNVSLFKALSLPPGLRLWMKNHYWWIVSSRDRERQREEELNNRAKPKTLPVPEIEPDSENDSQISITFDAPASSTVTNRDTENDGEVNEDLKPVAEVSEKKDSSGSQEGPAQLNDGASTSHQRLTVRGSRTHFLGRLSPIFVGLPEGGFSMLSSASTSSSASRATVTRSRSAPAEPSALASAAGASVPTTKMVRQPISSSEDEEDAPQPSARREPKRLRMRESIEAKADDQVNENVISEGEKTD